MQLSKVKYATLPSKLNNQGLVLDFIYELNSFTILYHTQKFKKSWEIRPAENNFVNVDKEKEGF